MPDGQSPRNSLAMQAIAIFNWMAAVAFLAEIGLVVGFNFQEAFSLEPVRISLLPFVVLAMAGAGILALRWRQVGAAPVRWLALAVPPIAFLAVFAPPFLHDLAHPSKYPSFMLSSIALGAAAFAIVAAIVAALETRSGAARWPGVKLDRPSGVAQVGAAALVLVLLLSGIFWFASTRPNATAQAGNHPSPGASVGPGPGPIGYAGAQVAQGSIPALPSDAIYASVAMGTVPAGGSADAHVSAGILYVSAGTLSVKAGATAQDLPTGGALFIPAAGTLHVANSGSAPATWYFLSIRRVADKSAAGAPTDVCQSANLPSLPPSGQAETLFAASLKAGGREQATKTGGVEVVVGVDGTVEVHAGTLDSPKQLTAGQCVVLLEGTPVQVANASKGDAHYLAFYLAPAGAPVATNSINVP